MFSQWKHSSRTYGRGGYIKMKEHEITMQLKLSLQRALLGVIYPAIRAIAYEFHKLEKLKIIFYLDREPNDDDYESISDVCAEVLGDMKFKK